MDGGADDEFAAFGHGLGGVEEDVEQGLFDEVDVELAGGGF